jgi:2-polyprenyl-6-methoxyphenol hydroxylase-like FAD-dependent oxidoreductase
MPDNLTCVIETEVLVVGAGPVGLTLAIELGRRGVACTLVERNEVAARLPKMERCNARTMEFFRRFGIAERVRDASFPRELPMDVFVVTSLAAPPILRLPYPSVAQWKAEIAAHNDGTRPLEPYQLISQYTLEPLLRNVAESIPSVSVEFGCELMGFAQDAEGVTATIRSSGGQRTVRARYLAGCDGGTSMVRKALGIKLEGRGRIKRMRRALFRCDDLFERIVAGPGRHYHVADELYTTIVVQDDTKHFTMSQVFRDDNEDVVAEFKRAAGMEIDVELLWAGEWTQHLLCAERYGDGRVFIAGDAAHLVIPTGALGMNTGAGDAIDLGWKLAGTLAGWGGPALLESYEIERRAVGLRNVKASANATSGRITWRSAYVPAIADDTPEGAAARAEMARIADVEQRKTNEMPGIELGYRYVGSPIVASEPGEGPDPDNVAYVPTTWPGARLPHVWLDDGSALHDRLGLGYTLLRLGAAPAETAALETAMRQTGAPFDVLRVADAAPRAVYGYDLLLIRPDLHVVWRGNEPPADPTRLAALATGRARLLSVL